MRELKRLDGTTRSPVYSFFSATLHGLLPIRAYRRGAPLQAAFVGKLQRNATAWYWWLIANRWFGFNLDLLCFIMVSATAFLAVALRDGTEPGLVGLALVYVLALSGMFQYMMRQSALVETYMTSVERISRYCRLESEESVLRRAHGEEKEEGEPEGV
jgi:ATP-binding cassette subfamily C (CFTR/MRP) protein 4